MAAYRVATRLASLYSVPRALNDHTSLRDVSFLSGLRPQLDRPHVRVRVVPLLEPLDVTHRLLVRARKRDRAGSIAREVQRVPIGAEVRLVVGRITVRVVAGVANRLRRAPAGMGTLARLSATLMRARTSGSSSK